MIVDPILTRINAEFTDAMNMPETQIQRIQVLSMGIIGRQEYLELGEALSEMVELEEKDEWRIDAPVYANACHIAAELVASSYPAPRIFNHGPKSVVFNWSIENKSYLTIAPIESLRYCLLRSALSNE